MKRRYLFTLEVAPVEAGKTYDELPSHLTLMSRFFSELTPEQLAESVRPLFARTGPVELRFGETAALGPEHLMVHMVAHTGGLRQLHMALHGLLDSAGAEYEYPGFIGDGYKPHVTKRDGVQYGAGSTTIARAAYLTEIVEGKRTVRFRFPLQNRERTQQAAIIIFTGLPGTGKTTLSRGVAEALHIPLIAKDAIKEIMYDTIGWSDKAFSAKLARATFGIMDHLTEQHIKTGIPVILESNYSSKLASATFQRWQEIYASPVIQIICRTDIGVLAERYADRAQHGARHPGHLDSGTVEGYRADFLRRIENGEDQPLDVAGPHRFVDTTDFKAVHTDEIARWIISQLPGGRTALLLS